MSPHAKNLIRLAALLACNTLCLFPSYTEARTEGTTKSGFVTTADGVRIHYLEADPQAPAMKSPALLFVPGWTMPAEIWEKQIAYFSKSRRVVAMDPRSQGLSSQTTEGHYPEARARDIKAVVDKLKLAPVVLVGWSMGVAELVAYVDQFGCDTLVGLLFVDDVPGWDLDPGTIQAFLKFFGQLARGRRDTSASFIRWFYKKPQSEAYLERVTRASLQTPTNTALALLLGKLTADLRPALPKIDRPALIVASGNTRQQLFEDFQKRLPGSRLEIFEDAGHALFVDDAERFNRTVEEFIAKLGP